MDASTTQKMELNAILDRVVPAAQMIMFGAMKADGLQFSASMRESGAAAKYLANSQNTYKDNYIVQGIVRSLSKRKGEHTEKADLRTLDTSEVMKKVDDINPILDGAMEQGTQTKSFLYGLAEAVVNASGSGFMGSGQRVTEDEAEFLAELKAHLRI